MSYEEPLYSNRNGVMLLEGLPSDLLPGAALAVAFRAGKSPKAEVRLECLSRIIELWPEGEAEILREFNRGMDERSERQKAGLVRSGRTLKTDRLISWNEIGKQSRAEARSVRNQLKVDQVKAEALRCKSEGVPFREFARDYNIYRKDRSSLPGILAEVRAVWGATDNA